MRRGSSKGRAAGDDFPSLEAFGVLALLGKEVVGAWEGKLGWSHILHSLSLSGRSGSGRRITLISCGPRQLS